MTSLVDIVFYKVTANQWWSDLAKGKSIKNFQLFFNEMTKYPHWIKQLLQMQLFAIKIKLLKFDFVR